MGFWSKRARNRRNSVHPKDGESRSEDHLEQENGSNDNDESHGLNDLEMFYIGRFDPVVYASKRPQERMEVFEKFYQDARQFREKLQSPKLVQTLFTLLERVVMKLSYDALGPISKGLVLILTHPLDIEDDTDLAESMKGGIAGNPKNEEDDIAHHTIAMHSTRDMGLHYSMFMGEVASMTKIPVQLSQMALEACNKLANIPQHRKQEGQAKAWTEVCVAWIRALLKILHVSKHCREVLARPSTFEVVFRFYDVIAMTHYENGTITSRIKSDGLRVLTEMCFVMTHDLQGSEVLAFAHRSKFVRKLALIMSGLSILHNKVELYYIAQCVSALPHVKFEDEEPLLLLLVEVFRKVNIDLGPFIDDEIFRLRRGLDEEVENENNEQEDAHNNPHLRRQHVRKKGLLRQDVSYETFSYLLLTIVQAMKHPKFGKNCVLNAGEAFSHQFGGIDITPRGVRGRRDRDMDLMDLSVSHNRTERTSSATEEEDDDSDSSGMVLMDLETYKARLVHERVDSVLQRSGVGHLWMHLLRLHEVSQNLGQKRLIDHFNELKFQVLRSVSILMPQHVPSPISLEIVLTLFTERTDRTYDILLDVFKGFFLEPRVASVIVPRLEFAVMKEVILKLFEMTENDEKGSQTRQNESEDGGDLTLPKAVVNDNTAEKLFRLVIQIGDAHSVLRLAIAKKMIRLLEKHKQLDFRMVKIFTVVLLEEVYESLTVNKKHPNRIIYWSKTLIAEGFLDLYQNLFERCELAVTGMVPFRQDVASQERKNNQEEEQDVRFMEDGDASSLYHQDLEILKWNSNMLLILSQFFELTNISGDERYYFKNELLDAELGSFLIDSCGLLQRLQNSETRVISKVLFDNETLLYELVHRTVLLHSRPGERNRHLIQLTSASRLTTMIHGLGKRCKFFMNGEDERNKLLGLLALIAEMTFLGGKDQLLRSVVTNEVSCRALFEGIATILEELVLCGTPDIDLNMIDLTLEHKVVVTFTRYALFILNEFLRSVDIDGRLTKDEINDLSGSLLTLLHQQGEMRDEIDESRHEKGLQVEGLHFITLCVWCLAQCDNSFCDFILGKPDLVAIPKIITLSCKIVQNEHDERLRHLARDVILVAAATLYLLVLNGQKWFNLCTHPAHPDMMEQVIQATIHSCRLITRFKDPKPSEGIILMLGLCWRLGYMLDDSPEVVRFRPLIPELGELDELVSSKETHNLAKIFVDTPETLNPKDQYPDHIDSARKHMDKVEEGNGNNEDDEDKDDDDDDDESNKGELRLDDETPRGEKRGEEIEGRGRYTLLDLVSALRESIIELFAQMPFVDPFQLRRAENIILMKKAPAGLMVLASLRRMQQIRLLKLDEKDNFAVENHLEKLTKGPNDELIMKEYTEYLKETPEIIEKRRQHEQEALIAASAKAREALRNARKQRFRGDGETSKSVDADLEENQEKESLYDRMVLVK